MTLDDLFDAAYAHPHRVIPLQWQGRKVWVKKPVADKTRFWHYLQLLVAKIIPALRKTTCLGGFPALKAEALRIETFRAAGFAVPKVLAVDARGLVLGDMGIVIDTEIKTDKEQSAEKLRKTISYCARLVARLHRAGLTHGRCKLNDIVRLADGSLGLIDFEEDISGLPQTIAQAREFFTFCASSARYTGQAADLMSVIVAAYRQEYPESAIWGELSSTLRKAKPLLVLTRPFADARQDDIGRTLRAARLLLAILAEERF